MITERVKYLIIGNSAGGISAAEAIREVDGAGTITIVSDEPYPVYSRPMIARYLAERCPLERMLFRPADFYQRNNIKTILGQRVVRLDVKLRTAELGGGSIINWEKLLLATGGTPIVPQMEGQWRRGVFNFITLDDARAIDAYLSRHPDRETKAVVIGGGLIGISASEGLVERGVGVTIIEMKDRVLNTILDEEASAIEASALVESGIEIITDHTVSAVESYPDGRVRGVTLDDGRSLACDLVVVAIGVRPRVELAAEAGLKLNRGIIVDRRMATSAPGVYACGDAAEAYDFIYGTNRLSPIWPNARLGGRVAGLNMAGVPTDYQGGTAMNSMKYFGVDIISAGMVVPPDGSYQEITARHDNIYRKIVLKNGLITGLLFAGDIEKAGIVYNLMKDGINVEAFKRALVADDFSLVSLPEELWRPRLAIPDSLLALSVTPDEEPEEALIGE